MIILKAIALGAHKMDKHFKTTDFKENIPVISGFINRLV